jgi:phytoene dehydrogenase-like protein
MADDRFDVIIIGSGHNGLVLGNYLARAGLKTLIVERRLEAGGGLSTEEVTLPGFLHNLHSYYHDTINVMPPYLDLGLEQYNTRYIRPPVQAGLATRDGLALTIHTDMDRTVRSLARLSPRDAKAFREMHDNYAEFIESVVIPALYTLPAPPSQQQLALETSLPGLDFLRMGRLTPVDVLDEHFEDDHVKALILHQLPLPRGVLHDYAGLGMVIPLVVSLVEHSQICVGGSHVLAHALWRSFIHHGGQSHGVSHVNKILIEGGAAVGVEMHGADRYYAEKAVASSVDLAQTFLELVDEEHLDPEFVRKVKAFRLDEFSIFSVHLALREPPRFAAAAFDPDLDAAFKWDVGLEAPADYQALWGEIRRGVLPEHLGMFCSCPTLHDPTQAPRGYHTGLLWQPAPYELADGGAERWDEVKDAYMARCLDFWRQYCPNLDGRNVLKAVAYTPLDIVRKLRNMRRGGVFMGRMIFGQLEYFRPMPELSQFRTPIERLYLCGAACHPGGGIIAAPGFIAASVICDDCGAPKWWER